MKADTVTKDYISDPEIFSDIFNYYIYGGQQTINPEQLSECDPTETALPYGENQAAVPVQEYRDVQKLYARKTDGKVEYILYGAEAQARIHYAMPVKNNLYDALEYAGQVEAASKSHRREMERRKSEKNAEKKAMKGTEAEEKKPNSGEFLSGFWKEDKLIPSVTLTIYFGPEIWDGPMSLFEMLEMPNPEILACMDNYHIRLIAPAQMPDSEIMKFQSSLREVMLFIKYSKDKNNLSRILEQDGSRFRSLERRAVDVIEIMTNVGMKYDEGEEAVNVCQAIQEIRKEEHNLGKIEQAKEAAKNFYAMGIEIEKIAKGLQQTVETVRQWLGLSTEI